MSLSNWPVAARLIAVFVIASVSGLIFGGLRVADAVGNSDTYGRTAQLAQLGEQVTALAQAMEDERDTYSAYAAYGVLASAAAADKAAPAVASPIGAALTRTRRQLAAADQRTDTLAEETKSLAAAVGPAFPASVQSKATAAITTIDGLPRLRSELARQPAGEIIASYSNSIVDLFELNDEITAASGDAQLSDEVRALGALSRSKDEASQQLAFLDAALLETSVNDAGGHGATAPYNNIGLQSLADAGGLGLLTAAQGLQFADLADFTNTATTAQSDDYQDNVSGVKADTAQFIDGFVIITQDPRLTFENIGQQNSLGFSRATVAATWHSDQTTVISEMRQIETQVMNAIVTRSQLLEHNSTSSAILTGAITAAAVLLVLLLTALVGRSLVNPLRRLQEDALEIATVRLPARVAAAAAGNEVAEDPIEPIGVQSTDEIGRVARAFDQVHAEAVRLAGNEAQLRGSFSAMFISLSRRSVPLIDRLARMIDGMEQSEDDPDQLANLFSMDHLVTRMRRNSENLLVLAGEEPVRKWTDPVPLSDVVRAAAAEIEQYGRVTLTVQPGVTVSGQAAADVVHLLAELIENATLFSPRNTQVRVTVTELSTGGVLVEVRDDGVGVSAARLTDMNWRLDNPPPLDVSVSRHMGLYAVAHLAARHGIRVKLRPGVPQGLSALVWLPSSLAGQERGPAGSGRSRSFGAVGNGAPVLTKQETGRHRGDLISERGEQPTVSGRQDQPALSGRQGQAERPATVWFTAKRPSTGAVRSTAEVAASWRPGGYDPGRPGRHQAEPAAGMAEYTAQTSTGLPRRVPRSSSYPDPAEAGMSGAAAGTGAGSLGTPLLGAPPGRTPAAPPTPYQQSSFPGAPPRAAEEGRAPAGRRSPEAMRDRLSGFQLGSRDGVHPGAAPRPAPPAKEENSQ